MKASFGVWILLAGCVGHGDGDKGPGGGGGPADDDSGSVDTADDTGEPEEEFVLSVCSDGAFTSVQAAVDAAPDGAVVELCGETFTEQVSVRGKSLTIRGGEAGAVLDGDGDVRPVEVVGDLANPATLVLESVTVSGGWADRGGGIWCEGATLSLTDVTIQGNGAEKGGGIASYACTIDMTRTEILDNEAWGEGGGGRLEGGSLELAWSHVAGNEGANGGGLLLTGVEGEAHDSVFEGNYGHVGGGLWFDGGFSIRRNDFHGNSSLYTGGGFGAVDGTGVIEANEVYDNHSASDGGGGFTQSFTGVVTGNAFHDNLSDDDAGGLRMLYGAALVQRNRFVANNASGGDGGALKVSHAGCEIRDNTFTDNYASGSGGGVEVDDDVSLLASNTFTGNEAGDRGGGVHFNEPYWDMSVEDLVLEGNVAANCGGAMAIDDDGLMESPEDIYTVHATHIRASGNSARNGGAVCVMVGGLDFTNALFTDNTASSNGAAAYVGNGTLQLTNATVAGNAGGPAIVVGTGGSTRVTDSIVAGNADGVLAADGSVPVWRYTLHQSDGTAFFGMADPTGENGNLEGDPGFRDAAGGDYRLDESSPAVNAGDPTRTDADGSRTDMGAFGGSGGDWE